MLMHRFLPLASASVIALACAAPVVAQDMTASEAWTRLQGMASQVGLSITSNSTSDMGAAIALNGVRIFPSEMPNDLVVTMESLRIEPRGELIALIPSAVIGVDTRFAGAITRQFEIRHDGEIAGALTDTNAALDLNFGTISAQLVHAERQGSPMDEAFSLTMTDFASMMRVARVGSADVTISAGTISYDMRSGGGGGAPSKSPTPAAPQVSASGEITAPRLTFSGNELDMLSSQPGVLRRAFDAGFFAHLTVSTEASHGTSSQMVEGMPVTMTSQAGASQMSVSLADGRFDAEVSADAGRIEGASGPMAGTVTFDGLGLNVGLPLVVTPDDQPMRYAFHFDNVMPSPELLTLLGAGQFGGDSVSLALDLGADGRMTREVGPDFNEGDVPPFDFSVARLDNVLVRVGDSQFTGAGAVTMIGGMMAQLNRAMPDADGSFTFNLVGGERLLNRLTAMGVVPNDQMFFVRMMMNGLGRSVGEDQLQSDVVIRPGGVVTVNGAPLPF